MSKIKIGWSEINITPEKKVSLAGQFAERISQYIEKPLTATAIAIESDNDYIIMCSCDLLGVSWGLLTSVRARLVEIGADFDVNKVIVSAIHTHTGPGYGGSARSAGEFESTKDLLKRYLPLGQEYIEREEISQNTEIATEKEVYDLLVDRISTVIMDAWSNRKCGAFSNAFGRAPVGMCRRAAYSDDTAQMWGDANTAVFTALEGGSDTGIELLYVFDANKRITGIVINLACPAQCVQHRQFVSPDFWGEVKVLLRKYFGEDLFVLPQCSAAGDQCPVDLIRWVEPESDLNDPNCKRNNPPKRKADPSMFDLSGMKLTGRRIANEVILVYEDGLDEVQSDVELEHRVINMHLPIRRASLTDLKNSEKAIKEYLRDKTGNVDYNDVANLQVHLGLINRFKLQEKLNTLETEVHVIKLGTISITTNPFELFLDYGNQIKARSNSEQTFLIQLANGIEGYLPTQTAEIHGHYSAFISSGQVGHIGGDMLVRETLDNINEMFKI